MKRIRHPTPCLLHAGYVRLPREAIDQAVRELVATAPHLEQRRYQHGVGLLARILAHIATMDQVMTEHPKAWLLRATPSGKIQISGGEKVYVQLIEQARRLLAELALTPAAAKNVGLDAASPDQVSIDALRQRYGEGESTP